jgi:N-acylglucosamine-6-phosphate 2-epimerase
MNNRRPRPLSEWLPGVHLKLIVSCQALKDEPLYGAEIMARMAVAVKLGGAVAIRANSPEDISAIR